VVEAAGTTRSSNYEPGSLFLSLLTTFLPSFQKKFYSTTTPPSGGTSVCTQGVETEIKPEPGQLLIGPRLSRIQDGGHLLTTEIARQVDDVFVEYGVDFTSEFIGGRKMLSSMRAGNETTRNANRSSILSETMTNGPIISKPRLELCGGRRERRRLQQAEKEYLFVFGGNLVGSYDQASFTAFWDRRFFLFEDSLTGDQFLNFYTFDNGGGQRSAPVIYMPPDNPITSETIRQAPLGIGELDFIRAYGGEVRRSCYFATSKQRSNLGCSSTTFPSSDCCPSIRKAGMGQ
jgi:hypothetical protein